MGRTHATHEFACSSRERWAQSVGMGEQKYKTVKHYHEPGDLHELTFSCYRRITLLTNTVICEKLTRSIDAAGEKYRMPLVRGFRTHARARPFARQAAR